MTQKDLLANQDSIFLEWLDPRPAATTTGSTFLINVYHRATVASCIAMARYAAIHAHNLSPDDPRLQDEDALLREFQAIHWTYIVEKSQ